jgi:hypothetical protein
MKTKFKELLNTQFQPNGFTIASETLSIGQKAERIAKMAKNAQDENGEFAKMFASNIAEWMEQIAQMAQSSLDNQLDQS